MEKTEKENFFIILCSLDSDDNSYIDLFDTIYTDDNRTAKFRISILYSLFEKEKINTLGLKAYIKYIGNGEISQMLIAPIFEEELDFTVNESKTGNMVMTKNNEVDVKLPEGINHSTNGAININYTTVFPKFGLYQIELYYKKEGEQEYSFAALTPLEVRKK